MVTGKKIELGKAVLDAKDSSGKNLATQVTDKVNLNSQDFVNKVDSIKLTEGVVYKLAPEEAQRIAEDIVNAITSDATKKNNPDPNAFKKYEKFAEKLAELLVNISNINSEEAHTLVKGKVSDWGLAKCLLLHSGLGRQEESLEVVEQKIDKEKLVEYLLEYAEPKGNVTKTKTIFENMAHRFVNDSALQKRVVKELRHNAGKVKVQKEKKAMLECQETLYKKAIKEILAL